MPAAALSAAFAVPGDEMAGLRKFFIAQLALFGLIPVFAAMMARGG